MRDMGALKLVARASDWSGDEPVDASVDEVQTDHTLGAERVLAPGRAPTRAERETCVPWEEG